MRLVFLLFISSFTSIACKASEWKYLADLQVPSGTRFQRTLVGGLSALAKTESRYFALSDDKGKFDQPRIYQYRIEVSPKPSSNRQAFSQISDEGRLGLTSTPERVIFLKNKNGRPLPLKFIDPEGLVVLGDSSFLVSSEGDAKSLPLRDPGLFLFDSNGILRQEIKFPDYYNQPGKGPATKGMRGNLGPECMSLSPSGKFLFVAFEGVLIQDGDGPSQDHEGFVRVLKYRVENNSELILDSEKLYPLSAAVPEPFPTTLVGTGISEIKALDDNQLLFLEKSANMTASRTLIYMRLFLANFVDGDEALGRFSIKDQNLKPMSKTLAVDLATFLPEMNPSRTLDNMEAMEFGPIVDGHRTLIVLSDDNFSYQQRSLWMLLQMPLIPTESTIQSP